MSNKHFTTISLTKLFDTKIKKKNFKGIDKVRPKQFDRNKKEEISRIVDRYNNSNYQFTPYLEILRTKGRNKFPRMISSSTVRDKITLTALKDYLNMQFSQNVPYKLANCIVKELKTDIDTGNYRYFFRTDIKSFYDSINREKLTKIVSKDINDPKALKLIIDSIENVTIPHNESKKNSSKYYSSRGIPQGLPISNILAQLYLSKIDRYFISNKICYYRFVDDIIILTKRKPIFKKIILRGMLLLIDLRINKEKSEMGLLSESFRFLGYYFKGDKLTLSESQISKFVSRLSGKFTWYKNGIENPESRPDWLVKNTDLFKECFINELNEKITGAKDDKKKYGWLFYFIEIDDLSLLYRIDNIIRRLFLNLDDFENKPPIELKSIVKAYFDIKYKNGNRYVHNYSDYKTVDAKRKFLVGRGKVNPLSEYSKTEIERIFEKYKSKRINILDKDIGYY